MPKKVAGFTILELIVVCVIVGILAALGLGSFAGPKEQAADREAQANLKLISSAEKVYKMEIGQYFPCVNTTEINNNLRLMLSTSDTNWRYKVTTNSGNTTFQANARRITNPTSSKVFCINDTQDNATNTGCVAPW
jgi:prepilin-type N-terminal cleavage/methylation domain-containing protein